MVVPSFMMSSSPKTCFLPLNNSFTLLTKFSGSLNKYLLCIVASVQFIPTKLSGVFEILNNLQNSLLVNTTSLFSSSSKTPL